MEHASSHKYIKNTPTNETALTEQLLNTRRKHRTCQRTRKITIIRQDDRKTKKRKPDWLCTPGGSLKRLGKFPHSENLPHWQGDQLGQQRSFRSSEKATYHLYQAEQRPTQMHMPLPCVLQLPPREGSRANCHLSRPQEQASLGCPLTEMGLKPQLRPRGCVTQEAGLKSLSVAT